MKFTKLINPGYIYQRRDRIVPKLKAWQESIESISHTLAFHGFPITPNDRRLGSFKNIHQGSIGFLIGNGPSVQTPDLEKLKDRVTFCCNRFYLAYDMMDFRPTYTLASDLQTIGDFGNEIVENNEGTIFIGWQRDWGKRPELKKNPIWINSNARKSFSFSVDIFNSVHPGGGTLISAIQIGYFMGINRFVLYGVDHDYKFVSNQQSEDVWHSAKGEGNHFIKNYRSGKPWCPPETKMIEKSFQTCDRFLRSQGGWLKNATRGGKLEVLERIDFDLAMSI